MAYVQKNNPFKKIEPPIIRGRKKHARSIREHAHHVEGEKPGSKSTHLMATYEAGGKHYVAPTISTDKKGYKPQSFEQAKKAGEVYGFKNKKRAEKFAAGSWKTGKDKRQAMRDYRKSKRNK